MQLEVNPHSLDSGIAMTWPLVVRRELWIPAAAAEVPLVEGGSCCSGSGAQQHRDIVNWLRKSTGSSDTARINDLKRCCDEEAHIQRHVPR